MIPSERALLEAGQSISEAQEFLVRNRHEEAIEAARKAARQAAQAVRLLGGRRGAGQ